MCGVVLCCSACLLMNTSTLSLSVSLSVTHSRNLNLCCNLNLYRTCRTASTASILYRDATVSLYTTPSAHAQSSDGQSNNGISILCEQSSHTSIPFAFHTFRTLYFYTRTHIRSNCIHKHISSCKHTLHVYKQSHTLHTDTLTYELHTHTYKHVKTRTNYTQITRTKKKNKLRNTPTHNHNHNHNHNHTYTTHAQQTHTHKKHLRSRPVYLPCHHQQACCGVVFRCCRQAMQDQCLDTSSTRQIGTRSCVSGPFASSSRCWEFSSVRW